jgi:hypothetical protein
MTGSTPSPPHRLRSSHRRAGCFGNGHVRFGGRPCGKGPTHRLVPRRTVDPAGIHLKRARTHHPYRRRTEEHLQRPQGRRNPHPQILHRRSSDSASRITVTSKHPFWAPKGKNRSRHTLVESARTDERVGQYESRHHRVGGIQRSASLFRHTGARRGDRTHSASTTSRSSTTLLD